MGQTLLPAAVRSAFSKRSTVAGTKQMPPDSEQDLNRGVYVEETPGLTSGLCRAISAEIRGFAPESA